MDRGGIKMSKSKENVKNGSYVYYSRLLEKSDDFLCVYKKTHHLTGMNAEECFNHYNEAYKYQINLINTLQNIYYTFEEYGSRYNFAKYLKDKGILPCSNSFYRLIDRVFASRDNLIYKGHLVRWQMVADAFQEFKDCDDRLKESA